MHNVTEFSVTAIEKYRYNKKTIKIVHTDSYGKLPAAICTKANKFT